MSPKHKKMSRRDVLAVGAVGTGTILAGQLPGIAGAISRVSRRRFDPNAERKLRAEVLTSWARGKPLNGNLPTNIPALVLQYREYRGVTWSDTTAQPSAHLPPVPNLVVGEVIAPESFFYQLNHDSGHHVLWAEPLNSDSGREQRMSDVEFEILRNILAANGVSRRSAVDAIGYGVERRNRRIVVLQLKQWLRSRPGGGDLGPATGIASAVG